MAVYEPRPETGYASSGLLACPSDWKRLGETERAFQKAETDRLLYVAATRAGTCLIVAHREQRVKDNPWHALADDLADQGSHQDPGPQVPPARAQVEVTLKEIEAARADVDLRWDGLREKTYTTEALKQISLNRPRPAAASVDEESLAPIAPADGEAPADSFAGEHGVEWGEDMHVLLEAAMRRPDANLESLARSLTRERDGDDERIIALVEGVNAVGQSAIWKRARASQRVLTEVPLMMMVPANESGTGLATVRRGVIDLAFLEPRGWVIVDYKTDRARPRSIPSLIEHYRPQVESYAETWGKLVGEVHEVGLFFTRVNRYEQVKGLGPSA